MQLQFREYLARMQSAGLPVFMDGGMGTMIQKSEISGFLIPEDVSFSNSGVIKNIHAMYIQSGANILTANTFGALPLKMDGNSRTAEEYIFQAAKILKEAVAEARAKGNENPLFAGWDLSQTGQLLEPLGSLTFDEAYDNYKTAAAAAEKAGFDVAIIETMADLYEVKAAVLAIKENTNLPIIATMTFQKNLRTLTGADVFTCVTYLEGLGVDVLGFNCGGDLSEGEELTRLFLKYAHTPVLVQPNAGLPVVRNGRTEFLVTPEEFAESQTKNRNAGALILGGCCGTTPEHIAKMVEKVRAEGKIFRSPRAEKESTFVCSYNKVVQIGGSAGPQIVGERINPTGKKKVKDALISKDMNFILGEAESQINAGAAILDVNTGLPGINEEEMMTAAVRTIQGAFSVPLQLDSSEKSVLEKAMRCYNGKPLVNSVNGRQEVMDQIFPLVKKYGGAVVCLCLDENGIAPDAEGRAAVARKIIAEAKKHGIKGRDIIIDTLTLTVSSNQKEALETCRAISLLKEEFAEDGVKFILGVSNISFGLPRRDIINSRFFAAALYAGLDACIINPLSEPMMETYYGFRALADFDENCLSYIEKYNGSSAPLYGVSKEMTGGTLIESQRVQKAEVPKKSYSAPANDLIPEEENLISIICKGFKDQASCAVQALLDKKIGPVSIIDRCIVSALDCVGKDFEEGTKFLPQLLLSAETVSNAFEVIKSFLAATGAKTESKGKIVIATVFGDIHDIGKNIVKAMLENYGYDVIDLGKNVPPETFVSAVIENDVKLAGLSALMTTTVSNMEDTIRLLRSALKEKNKSCKIMVGGAVLTEEYAARIDADYYSKDAMASVAIAKEVFNG